MTAMLTQHNDRKRTGANLQETVLNTVNVRHHQFGLIHRYEVEGQVYAQPLLASNVGNFENVLYVATMHNMVYAFNADSPFKTVWKTAAPLKPPIPLPDPEIGPQDGDGYRDIHGEVGILSTPVASPSHNALFLVLTTKQGNHYGHFLYALDLTTGALKPNFPVDIAATVPLWIATNRPDWGKTITFDSRRQLQRAALLDRDNELLYIAFAAYGDRQDYNGWVLAFDQLSGALEEVLNTTPGGKGGGIWQAGQGLALSDRREIFGITGNGSFNMDPSLPPDNNALGDQLSDCFLKLTLDLSLGGFFSPFNNKQLDNGDLDLGSAGPVLIPVDFKTPDNDLLVGGGKEGRLYLLDPNTNLGQFNPQSDSNALQDFRATFIPTSQGEYPHQPGDQYEDEKDDDRDYTYHIHGSPVFWRNDLEALIYLWGENDFLRAYAFENGRFVLSKDYLFADPKRTLNQQTNETAAVAINFDNTLLAVAWSDDNNFLSIASSPNGRDFGPPTPLTGPDARSDYEPGFAFGAKHAALAWTGGDGQLNAVRTIDLINFIDKRTYDGDSKPEELSDYGPALAFGDGRFFLAFTGTDGQINVMTSVNGVDYSNKVVLADQLTDAAPRVAFVGSRIYVLFKGIDNQQLNVYEMTAMATVVPTGRQTVLNERSDFAPSLASDPKSDRAYLAWTGRNQNLFTNTDPRLNTLVWPSIDDLMTGKPGRKQVQIELSLDAPYLTMFNNQLFMTWTGEDEKPNVAMMFHPEPRTGKVKATNGMPGAMLSLTANGSVIASGIVWAARPSSGDANHFTVPGILHAFNAADISQELWNSKMDPADGEWNFAKFCPPTVANGKVYLATFSEHVRVYGLKPS
jgi:outer membrane protein assembly factor BamB